MGIIIGNGILMVVAVAEIVDRFLSQPPIISGFLNTFWLSHV
jgi:hypothetical protein